MRANLKKMYHGGHKTCRFYAKVERIFDDGRILLSELKDSNLKLLEDHFWTGERYWFSDVKAKEGLQISFIADIGFYRRRNGLFDLKPKDLREIRAVGAEPV